MHFSLLKTYRFIQNDPRPSGRSNSLKRAKILATKQEMNDFVLEINEYKRYIENNISRWIPMFDNEIHLTERIKFLKIKEYINKANRYIQSESMHKSISTTEDK